MSPHSSVADAHWDRVSEKTLYLWTNKAGRTVVIIVLTSLVLTSPLASDLGDVGARQHHRDELHEAEDDADHGVHDHHGQHVRLELVLRGESGIL